MAQNAVNEESGEATLVERARQGSVEAFGDLVHAYQHRVYALAWSVLRNDADAEDAAQEAFVRAFQSMHALRPEIPWGPWMCRIAINVAINNAKARGRRHARLQHLRLVAPPRHEPPNPAFTEAEMERALLALSPRQRLAVELFHRDQCTYQEIAELMGASMAHVKNHIHRGRKKLRKLLDRERRNANDAEPMR